MDIEFFGAAGGVTGSCHILRVGGQTVLLDCGLIQGSHKDEARNHDPFPFEAGSIDAVVLSHAHLDHCGRLPLLVRRGFRDRSMRSKHPVIWWASCWPMLHIWKSGTLSASHARRVGM